MDLYLCHDGSYEKVVKSATQLWPWWVKNCAQYRVDFWQVINNVVIDYSKGEAVHLACDQIKSGAPSPVTLGSPVAFGKGAAVLVTVFNDVTNLVTT